MIYDAIIVGGGPSGLMAANQFEAFGLKYLLLEKNDVLGKKLLLTGGRRCNVTNRFSAKEFVDALTIKNKKFLFSALNAFGTKGVLDFFNKQGLGLILEEGFKYFPQTHKSQSVLDALTKNIKHRHIKYNQSVKSINKDNDFYLVNTKDNQYQCLNVIIGTGSKSYPTTGSNGDGLIFANQFHIDYDDFTPAETYVYSNQVVQELGGLQGVSINDCKVDMIQVKQSFTGDLIFTHKGLSGPVIMHLSEFIYEDIILNGQSMITITFINQTAEELYENLLKHKDKILHKVLEMYAQKRIVDVILKKANISSKKIIEIKKKDLLFVSQLMTKYTITIDGVEARERAYVNKGGVSLKALDPKTMEVKQQKGLYFVGETTGLHGPIGGFNLTIAFSTGYISAIHIIQKLKK